MIRFAVVHRAKDGLALSASTDMESGVELRESKRYAKLLSRKARQFPIRCWMPVGRFRIFFLTESDVCFLLISEANFAPVLAYSFLDDLKKEFLGKYTRGTVDKAIRPYSFIEFDGYIQKIKQKYNSTRTLHTRINLSDIGEELKNNPPYEVFARDLGATAMLQHRDQVSVTKVTNSAKRSLAALTTVHIVSLLLTAVCAILNVIRLIPFISQHTADIEEESHWKMISLIFFFSMVDNLLQCYIMVYTITGRSYINVLCAISGLFFVYLLSDFRNIIQISFHVVSDLFITYNVWNRPCLAKLPNYNV